MDTEPESPPQTVTDPSAIASGMVDLPPQIGTPHNPVVETGPVESR